MTTEPFSRSVGRDEIVARIRAHPIDGSPDEQRRAFAELVLGDAAAPPSSTLRIEPHGDITPRTDTGSSSSSSSGSGSGSGTIVHFHGGGYVFGSPQTHVRIGRGLAARTGLPVLLPAYPLAPEHRWPEPLDAALTAVSGIDGPILLAGDSAGGHLALVTALELGRRGTPPAGLVLLSPNTDRTGRSTTRIRNEPTDPMVDDEGDRALANRCFGDLPDDHLHVSPLLDDLRLLPPLHLEVGEGEVLLDDSRLLADGVREVGGSVGVHVEPAGLHMMQLWAPWWPTAAASLDRVADFTRTVFAPADPPSHRDPIRVRPI